MPPPATDPAAVLVTDRDGGAAPADPADVPEPTRPVPADAPEPARPVPPDSGEAGSARPVALHLAPDLHDPLARWVEGVLGWQVVDRQTGALVPPTVRLVDPGAAPPEDGVPRLLVVADLPSDPGGATGLAGEAGEARGAAVVGAARVAAAAVRLRAAGVVAWPGQRDELPAAVAAVADTARIPRDAATQLHIGGVAGGVGTTTVTLAVAGLAAWRGARVLAGIRGDAPTAPALAVPADAVAASDLWGRLTDVTGVDGLRVVQIADPAPVPAPRDPAVELTVVDHGVDVDVDVLVCRPDAAALQGVGATTAAAIVVVGEGPLPLRELRERAGGRRIVPLAWSLRVARAGLRRRVPTALPGAWLRTLIPLLPGATPTGTFEHGPVPPDD